MTIKLINFKANTNNPDDLELLEFFNITKDFGFGKTDLCKLALKRLISDIIAGNLKDGSFSPHLIARLSESEKITGSSPVQQESLIIAKEDLEILDSELETISDDMAAQMKNLLGGS